MKHGNKQQAGAEHRKFNALVGCPFCGSQAVEIEEGVFSIKHQHKCWIVDSGFHCDFLYQFFTTQAEQEAWNKRASNDRSELRLKEENDGTTR